MGRKNGIYPQIWLSGPDPIDHKLYNDCQRARAQAWYRGEEWTITEAEYIAIWRENDYYKNKGRASDQYCLVRKDYEKGWFLDNVEIRIRLDHYKICNQQKIGKYASGAKRLKIQEKLRNARSRI
jgi:hypothetical protein